MSIILIYFFAKKCKIDSNTSTGSEKMECMKLFEKTDALAEKYISVWEDICIIESPTEYKEGLDMVGNYFLKMSANLGWQTEICKQASVLPWKKANSTMRSLTV